MTAWVVRFLGLWGSERVAVRPRAGKKERHCLAQTASRGRIRFGLRGPGPAVFASASSDSEHESRVKAISFRIGLSKATPFCPMAPPRWEQA